MSVGAYLLKLFFLQDSKKQKKELCLLNPFENHHLGFFFSKDTNNSPNSISGFFSPRNKFSDDEMIVIPPRRDIN